MRLWQVIAKETTSGGSTSSGLGSSTPVSAEAVPHHVEDDDGGGELQTEKLVSACNNAVRRLSSPISDSDPIELDSLAWQGHGRPDSVEQPSSPRR